MNSEFTEGFEKVAWGPMQGVGQVIRGVKNVSKAIGRNRRATSTRMRQSFKKGLNPDSIVDASKPHGKLKAGQELRRSKKNLIKREKWQEKLDASKSVRESNKKIRSRVKDIKETKNLTRDANGKLSAGKDVNLSHDWAKTRRTATKGAIGLGAAGVVGSYGKNKIEEIKNRRNYGQ